MAVAIKSYDQTSALSEFGPLANSQVEIAPRHEMDPQTLAIVDDRALDRECLARSLVAHGLDMAVDVFSSIDSWRKASGPRHAGILINVGHGDFYNDTFLQDLQDLIKDFPAVHVVILADNRDLRQVLQAFEVGVRGYISSAIGLAVCVSAISLALAGGAFISAETLDDLPQLMAIAEKRERHRAAMFTQREADVIDALSQGKPNKIIAYELTLRESTVKVHIRNIMKKLNARNRTEVIFKISDMYRH